MRDISRQIEKIEEKLNINRHRKPKVIMIIGADDKLASDSLPKNLEEWLTYKEDIRKCPNTNLVLLFASRELAARGLSDGHPKENLQKATKDNELTKV